MAQHGNLRATAAPPLENATGGPDTEHPAATTGGKVAR